MPIGCIARVDPTHRRFAAVAPPRAGEGFAACALDASHRRSELHQTLVQVIPPRDGEGRPSEGRWAGMRDDDAPQGGITSVNVVSKGPRVPA